MIIRAGVNIYPAEIEGALLEDPRTEQVLAYGVAGRDRRKRYTKCAGSGCRNICVQGWWNW